VTGRLLAGKIGAPGRGSFFWRGQKPILLARTIGIPFADILKLIDKRRKAKLAQIVGNG
jgi:hypothetical protein